MKTRLIKNAIKYCKNENCYLTIATSYTAYKRETSSGIMIPAKYYDKVFKLLEPVSYKIKNSSYASSRFETHFLLK